ncbi:hypothetical protein E9229_001063 [Paeniglutamicibacter cryotolerans]|uniref:Uncharacterized protein n=1 Tax=Paeniglutamicibacter cryotolerans TaxID=670079 RepID=A0A839QNT4_9MICC|nr:hypothetical protein [Paeniglutamicibacter cryotolerans]
MATPYGVRYLPPVFRGPNPHLEHPTTVRGLPANKPGLFVDALDSLPTVGEPAHISQRLWRIVSSRFDLLASR